MQMKRKQTAWFVYKITNEKILWYIATKDNRVQAPDFRQTNT